MPEDMQIMTFLLYLQLCAIPSVNLAVAGADSTKMANPMFSIRVCVQSKYPKSFI